MTGRPEDPVLDQLRAIRADLSDVQGCVGEIKSRLSGLDGGQASIVQHLGHLAMADAQQQLALDGLTQRLVRIERRLDLRDA